MEQSYLTFEEDDDPMGQIQGHSITYRIAVGEQQGQKDLYLANPATE